MLNTGTCNAAAVGLQAEPLVDNLHHVQGERQDLLLLFLHNRFGINNFLVTKSFQKPSFPDPYPH